MNLPHRSESFKFRQEGLPAGAWAQAGYSYFQILVVVALLAILAGVSAPYYFQFHQRQRLQATTDTIWADLHIAQTKARQRQYGEQWGLHIAAADNTYVIFRGSTYDSADSYNIAVAYPTSIDLSPDQDIVFTPVTGGLDGATTATVVVSSVALPNESRMITINEEGTFNY